MDPRTFWNERFSSADFAYGTAPNAFLAEHFRAFPPNGELLSLGEGEGRNAAFLAEQGFHVTAVDLSSYGLNKAQALAAGRGVSITTVEADLNAFDLGQARWDGIYNIFCHVPPELRTRLYARIRQALRPGGVFLTEQYAKDQLRYQSGGPKDERMLISLEELQQAFAGDEVRYAAWETTTLNEGPLHQGLASVIRFIVRRPAADE
jgi:SAM-dependent methyltransferase